MEHISWQNPFINNGGPNFSSVMAMFGSSTIFQTFFCCSLQFFELWCFIELQLYTAKYFSLYYFLWPYTFLLIFQFDVEVELKRYNMFSKHYIFLILFRFSKIFFHQRSFLKNHNFRCSAIENSAMYIKFKHC